MHNERGIALITVMLISAIAAIISVQVIENQDRSTRRTIQLINSDQGILSVWSIENFVKIYLAKDKRESKADFPGEDWTAALSVPFEGGVVSGRLEDETAKYNLNNIMDAKGKIQLAEANRVLSLFRKLNIESAEEIFSAIIDWMDSDSNVYRELRPYQGAEDRYYTQLDPPYRTANSHLLDITELRLVKGMTSEIYRKLTPFLSTLPEYTPVNANFAKSEVLAMLDDKISADAINSILKRQNKKDAFQSYPSLIREIQNYVDSSTHKKSISKNLSDKVINVSTKYFRLDTEIYFDQSETRVTSLLRRDKGSIEVVWRNFGVWDR